MNTSITLDPPQIAVLELHVAGFHCGTPSARPAWIALHPDRPALRTISQALAVRIGEPCFMREVTSFFVLAERPFDLIFWQPVFVYGTGVIDDARPILIGCPTKHQTDPL